MRWLNSSLIICQDLLKAGLLLCALLVFYHPVIHGGMLFDDNRHITLEALRSLHGLWRIWVEPGAADQYYPVLHSAFWLEWCLWGDSVTGYHLVNLLLHACCAFLIVALMRRLALPGAWFAAFIFALHPVCVESVAWISEQKNTLSTLFYLGSMFVYLGFDRERRSSLYIAALFLFLMALLSKTVTATLPGALLVIFWWQRGRIDWKRDLLPLLPWIAMGAAGGLLSGWMERRFYGAVGSDFSMTFLERCLMAGRIPWFYSGKLFWPVHLMFHYPFSPVRTTEPWQYMFLFGLLLILAGLCVISRWSRGPMAAFLLYIGTLFPVLGFLNIKWFVFSPVADHFQYLASLGIIVPVTSGIVLGVKKIPIPWMRHTVRASGYLLLLILSSLTWRHSQVFRDMETFYKDTLAGNPESYLAHYNYGLVLIKLPGRLPDALFQFDEALRLRPDDAVLQNGVGVIFMSIKDRQDRSIDCFKKAILLNPDYAVAHLNLAQVLEAIPGRLHDAAVHYETALRIKPGFEEAKKGIERIHRREAKNPES